MAVESKALNFYRVTGRFSCIPRHILTKKLRCKLQSVQIVTFHIIKVICLRLSVEIMENFRLLPVVVIQLNMKEPHITFVRKFDLIFAHAQTLFSPVMFTIDRIQLIRKFTALLTVVNQESLSFF